MLLSVGLRRNCCVHGNMAAYLKLSSSKEESANRDLGQESSYNSTRKQNLVSLRTCLVVRCRKAVRVKCFIVVMQEFLLIMGSSFGRCLLRLFSVLSVSC
jgi:hypothetical protein